MRTSFVVLAVGSILWSGCNPPTDLGRTCVMVKKDPKDAKKSIPIKESEIKSSQDFLSFGSTECENQVCVRDSAYKRPSNATDNSDALGYCSSRCISTSTSDCIAESSEDNKAGSPTKLTCRAMLLDEATLANLKSSDPVAHKRYFGETTTPYFCARGGK